MLVRRDTPDRETLARTLAEDIAVHLKAGIARRGAAVLAVSGGSTPRAFFEALAGHGDIDWPRVTVTLVDERWVAESSERSNAGLVRRCLLQGPAAAAGFVPLYSGGERPDAGAVAHTNAALKGLSHPFAAVVLGMGNDGHTASFFPGGDALDQALTDKGPAIAIDAPGAGEPRITLTLPHLLGTDALYLHIEGAEKAATLARALEDGAIAEMPVRAVLRQKTNPVTVFWCP